MEVIFNNGKVPLELAPNRDKMGGVLKYLTFLNMILQVDASLKYLAFLSSVLLFFYHKVSKQIVFSRTKCYQQVHNNCSHLAHKDPSSDMNHLTFLGNAKLIKQPTNLR